MVSLFLLMLLMMCRNQSPFHNGLQMKIDGLNKSRNIISFALTLDEFYRISVCTSAREMWEILRVTHEGIDDVKRARRNSLIQ